ncbi:NADH:flavin oxidoreductase/NADH oxidase family protein [Rheinheimera sediminis]|uniref:NADH:flavin oxidoreductase/NADH oxidase family protein n=1 Tax=Rheinheimera sp. YQF-1 TaxID=2499626 RepID=UPI000FD9C10E|nr:NADH:flavin oxidoreductase/NADH oxidase family protein [Rheinheimera sp. YQF-1]RVT43037.1 NADH:flavin oxidoreductase/NADH oxidase family protein [Rheinheimera sp. YQF-1]
MLFETTTLPNGVVLKNRLVKAAMEENMAAAGQNPSAQLIELYKHWALGGAGLLISGNVMVSRKALTGPGGVVLDAKSDLTLFKGWAEAGQLNGTKLILQLNHPGRQMPASLGQEAMAPSAIALDLGQFSKMFASPRAMTLDDIAQFKQQFLLSSQLALQAGFAGVQIHAAHGYLLSQFLSPLVNQRQDQYGGSLENRARLVLELVSLLRAELPSGFVISLKLNSADFQRGGFSAEDARQVVLWLNPLALDFVELSGGSYEAPAMQGDSRDGSTLAREAYFLDFAKELQQAAHMPLMLTGGIRRQEVADQVLHSGIALVGIATALALVPNLPQRWQQGDALSPELPAFHFGKKPLQALAKMAYTRLMLRRFGQALPFWSICRWHLAMLVLDQLRLARLSRRYKQQMGL